MTEEWGLPEMRLHSYLSCNVGSCQFVGVPSMVATRMDNITYRECECWSHYLGGPSPVCAPHVGHRFTFVKEKKSATVDKYGDSVVNACLPGDGWRVRHDKQLQMVFGRSGAMVQIPGAHRANP